MKLNTDYITYLRKNTDSYSFGCDYLTLTITRPLNIWEEVRASNTTNSNYTIVHWEFFKYTATLTKAQSINEYVISGVYNDISYPLFRLLKFSSLRYWQTLWVFNIYWTTFRLIEIGIIPSLDELLVDFFWQEDYDVIEGLKISRYDYKIDLFYSKNTALPKSDKVISGKKAESSDFKSKLNCKTWSSVPEFAMNYINKLIFLLMEQVVLREDYEFLLWSRVWL